MELHHPWYEFRFKCFAGPCEVQLHCDDAALAQSLGSAVADEARRIESKYSRFRDDSLIGAINSAAGKRDVAIDAETFQLFKFAEELYETSDGLFDLTSGVLRRVWNKQRTTWPTDSELNEMRRLVGWNKFRFSQSHAALSLAGMELDLGGIGKEYAVDRASAVLAEAGITRALVNFGGDVRVLGNAPGGDHWKIGVRNPLSPSHALMAIDLPEGSVCTSGSYERTFQIQGRDCSHFLDPRSAQPVNYFSSVTVMAPLCVAAGGISTVVCLMPRAQGLNFLEEMQVDAIAIDGDGVAIGFGRL